MNSTGLEPEIYDWLTISPKVNQLKKKKSRSESQEFKISTLPNNVFAATKASNQMSSNGTWILFKRTAS